MPLNGDAERTETTIEARHDDAAAASTGGDDLVKLIRRQGEGLFDKHVLPGLQRLGCEFGVCVVAGGNYHRVYAVISKKLIVVAGRQLKTVPICGAAGREAA